MNKPISNLAEKLIHVLVWAFLFASPLLMMDRSESGISWLDVVHRIGGPLVLFILFYTNYFFLVPRLFLNNRKWTFSLVNLGFCVVLFMGLIQWERLTSTNMRPGPSLSEIFQIGENPRMMPDRRHGPRMNPNEVAPKPEMNPEEFPENPEMVADGAKDSTFHRRGHYKGNKRPGMTILGIRMPVLFLFRDFLLQILCIIVAVTTRMSKKWRQSERALKDAEVGRAEAELKNLRSQINPHFLLNTLNNIYALIVFDQEKAQETVQELSKLLRHVLYDNQQQFVPMDSEVEFLHSYIGLMKIRLPKSAEVTVENTLPQPNSLKIAPLMFISLVENAFKHGIRTSEKSFIHLRLEYLAESSTLHFRIENSNFPKDEADRSGSGIGLEQVQKRLDLIYPGQYTWEKGVKDNTYFSDIKINMTN